MKRKPHAPKTAADIVTERGIQYGDAVAGMTRAAARWSVTLGVPVSAVQVCQCMIDLKQSRLDYAPLHEDSALDIGGYAEIIRRIQAKKRGLPTGAERPTKGVSTHTQKTGTPHDLQHRRRPIRRPEGPDRDS